MMAQIPLAFSMGDVLNTNLQSSMNQRGVVCSQCGNLLVDRSKFCSNCGKEVVNLKFCSKCGSKLNGNAKFCSECGEKVL